jgi:hypothetical protein
LQLCPFPHITGVEVLQQVTQLKHTSKGSSAKKRKRKQKQEGAEDRSVWRSCGEHDSEACWKAAEASFEIETWFN